MNITDTAIQVHPLTLMSRICEYVTRIDEDRDSVLLSIPGDPNKENVSIMVEKNNSFEGYIWDLRCILPASTKTAERELAALKFVREQITGKAST